MIEIYLRILSVKPDAFKSRLGIIFIAYLLQPRFKGYRASNPRPQIP